MSALKMNLRSGAANLAQFVGIGKGVKPAAKKTRVTPFVGIGGNPAGRGQGKRAEDNSGADDMMPPDDNGDDNSDDDGDDQALEDDDYGADAPNDDDAPEEAEAKRARRVARRARRMKNKDTNPPADDPADPANPPADAPSPPDEDADDEDADIEMRGQGPAAMARRRERARCAAIFGHKAAASNLELAAHLAFNTSMTRSQVITALAAAPARRGGELADAMRDYVGQRPGTPPAPQKPQGAVIAAGWDSAFAEAAASRSRRKK